MRDVWEVEVCVDEGCLGGGGVCSGGCLGGGGVCSGGCLRGWMSWR